MPRQGKKIAKRLAERIADWEKMKGADDKNKIGTYNETYYRKPGSMKK